MKGNTKDGHARAVWMLLLTNFLWGLSFPTVKALAQLHAVLIPGSSTWFVTAMTLAPRFLLATLFLGLFLGRRLLGIHQVELRQGLILGFFTGAGMLFQNDGLQFTHASVSAFLTQFYAILIPLYLALRYRRNPGLLVWSCVFLVLAGCAVLGQFDWRHFSIGRGEAETLLCSVFFTVQILALDRPEFAGNRPMNVSFVMFATEMVLFCGLAAWTTPSASALLVPWTNIPWLGMTLVLALCCTLGAFLLMNTWQPRISATEAGLIYCVEPIFGTLMAMFLPAYYSIWAGISYANETAGWTLLIGGGLITAANVLLQLRPPARAEAAGCT